jgi:hypothetical protein
MVSKGQIAWSKMLEDIKDVKGWPYPKPFYETIVVRYESIWK